MLLLVFLLRKHFRFDLPESLFFRTVKKQKTFYSKKMGYSEHEKSFNVEVFEAPTIYHDLEKALEEDALDAESTEDVSVDFNEAASEELGNTEDMLNRTYETLRRVPEVEKISELGMQMREWLYASRDIIDATSSSITDGDYMAAIENLKSTQNQYTTMRESLAVGARESLENLVTKARSEKGAKAVRFISSAVDLLPYVGPAKMLAEGVMGKTASGEKLEKWKRMQHFSEGGAFLALDVLGPGVIAKAGKGAKSAKALTRFSALMRKSGISREIYRPVFKAGRFALHNPRVGQTLDRGLHAMIINRKKQYGTLLSQMQG